MLPTKSHLIQSVFVRKNCFLLQVHKYDIINIGIASSGKFIMSCSSDTTLIIWNIKGKTMPIAKHDEYQPLAIMQMFPLYV